MKQHDTDLNGYVISSGINYDPMYNNLHAMYPTSHVSNSPNICGDFNYDQTERVIMRILSYSAGIIQYPFPKNWSEKCILQQMTR
jgi:hypothetical protein